MQILGFHIISNKRLLKERQDAADWERGWSSWLIGKLLANYEDLRQGMIRPSPLEQLQKYGTIRR